MDRDHPALSGLPNAPGPRPGALVQHDDWVLPPSRRQPWEAFLKGGSAPVKYPGRPVRSEQRPLLPGANDIPWDKVDLAVTLEPPPPAERMARDVELRRVLGRVPD